MIPSISNCTAITVTIRPINFSMIFSPVAPRRLSTASAPIRIPPVSTRIAATASKAGLAAAGGVLLVATTHGALYCFAEPSPATPSQAETVTAAGATTTQPTTGPTADVDYARAAEEILEKSGVSEGICLDLGCGAGQLAAELVRRSRLHVIGIEADPTQVGRARRMLAAAGLYGNRVTIHHGNPAVLQDGPGRGAVRGDGHRPRGEGEGQREEAPYSGT